MACTGSKRAEGLIFNDLQDSQQNNSRQLLFINTVNMSQEEHLTPSTQYQSTYWKESVRRVFNWNDSNSKDSEMDMIDLFLKGSIIDLKHATDQVSHNSAQLQAASLRELHALEQIKDSLAHINELLAHMNRFQQSMTKDTRLESCNITQELDLAASVIKQKLPERTFLLKVDHIGANHFLMDRFHIQTVFRALLQNAVQYSLDQYPIIIEVILKITDSHFSISIKDQGIGIDLEKHGDQLFLPFKKISTASNGPGLGLTISKKIVESYKGSIMLESIPESGTTVTALFQNLDLTD